MLHEVGEWHDNLNDLINIITLLGDSSSWGICCNAFRLKFDSGWFHQFKIWNQQVGESAACWFFLRDGEGKCSHLPGMRLFYQQHARCPLQRRFCKSRNIERLRITEKIVWCPKEGSIRKLNPLLEMANYGSAWRKELLSRSRVAENGGLAFFLMWPSVNSVHQKTF